MQKRISLSLFLLCFFTLAEAQSNSIIAGEKGTATYVDWIPNHSVTCWPTPPSETCGPINDSLDLNNDSIMDFVLSSYHTGYQGLSYEFHYITPLNNNEVLTDTMSVFNPFQGNIVDWRAMPIDSGMLISNDGIYAQDSFVVTYLDSLGAPSDSMQHFQRHFQFHNNSVVSSGSFFMDIPAVLYFNSFWKTNSNASKLYLGLRLFKGSDTLYAWIRTDNIKPRVYYDYTFTGKLSDIDDSQLVNSIAMFPNPSDGMVTLKIPNQLKCSITVIDALGKAVKQFSKMGSLVIDCTDLSKGVYFIKIDAELGSVTKKLIL